MRSPVDVVVGDLSGTGMVDSAAHIPGHVAAKTTQLKEETYVLHLNGDLFFLFAVEVFGAFHPSSFAPLILWLSRIAPSSQFL